MRCSPIQTGLLFTYVLMFFTYCFFLVILRYFRYYNAGKNRNFYCKF